MIDDVVNKWENFDIATHLLPLKRMFGPKTKEDASDQAVDEWKEDDIIHVIEQNNFKHMEMTWWLRRGAYYRHTDVGLVFDHKYVMSFNYELDYGEWRERIVIDKWWTLSEYNKHNKKQGSIISIDLRSNENRMKGKKILKAMLYHRLNGYNIRHRTCRHYILEACDLVDKITPIPQESKNKLNQKMNAFFKIDASLRLSWIIKACMTITLMLLMLFNMEKLVEIGTIPYIFEPVMVMAGAGLLFYATFLLFMINGFVSSY